MEISNGRWIKIELCHGNIGGNVDQNGIMSWKYWR